MDCQARHAGLARAQHGLVDGGDLRDVLLRRPRSSGGLQRARSQRRPVPLQELEGRGRQAPSVQAPVRTAARRVRALARSAFVGHDDRKTARDGLGDPEAERLVRAPVEQEVRAAASAAASRERSWTKPAKRTPGGAARSSLARTGPSTYSTRTAGRFARTDANASSTTSHRFSKEKRPTPTSTAVVGARLPAAHGALLRSRRPAGTSPCRRQTARARRSSPRPPGA